MKEVLKILFVENNLADAKLIWEEITDNKIQFEKVLTDNRKDYTEYLRSSFFDLIISDYSLHQFDGMKALLIRNDIVPDVPFLLVTGAQNEEIAVECMKAGADDYILKQNLSRLGEAIKSAIKKKEILRQKRAAEENLRISELRFKDVAEHLGEWVWEVDTNGLYKYVSPVSISLLGYTPEELINKKYFYDSFLPDTKDYLKVASFEVFSRKETFKNFENPNIHKDGHIVFLSTSGNPILDDMGNLIGYRGADKDITAQKRSEELLRQSEEKYRSIYDNSSIAILLTSPDGKVFSANDYACKLFNMTENEICNLGRSGLIDLNDSRLPELLDQRDKTGRLKGVLTFIKKDGVKFQAEVSSIVFKNKEGSNLTSMVIRDLSEQLRSEDALKKSEARLRSYFDLSGAGIAITSLSADWMEVNDQLCGMLGYTREEIQKTTWTELTHPDDLEIDLDNFNKVISGETDGYSIDKRFIKKDGKTVWTNLSVRCVRNQSGKVEYFIALLFDITERKQIETELIKAKIKAEESDKLKTAFLRNISHEIRTPLNAILGFGALLTEPGITPDMRASYMQTINDGTEQLLSIINTIVNISSAEARILTKNVTTFNLNASLNSLLKQFQLKALENSNQLSLKLGLTDKDSVILSDSTRLIQILSNLLTNALKFTQKGNVYFGYKVTGTTLEFFVYDSGIGIPPDQYIRIFDSFYQVDSSYNRKYGGTGLGLSISKAYVELLGGKIWLSSELNKGSKFYFTIPFDKPASQPVIKDTEKELVELGQERTLVILVVEDNEINFKLIGKFLANKKVRIIWAKNGKEAVDYCKSMNEIDLVLMDLRMPVMNGYEATRLIREFRPGLPVIAQTAYSDDKLEALKSGCVDFLSKPFSRNDFMRILSDHIIN